MFCPRCHTFTNEPAAPDLQQAEPRADNAETGGNRSSSAQLNSSAPDNHRSLFKAIRSPGDRHCGACGTLLTPNRLAAEFPGAHAPDESAAGASAGAPKTPGEVQEDAAALASGPPMPAFASDAPVTIQEILRATAGPNPVSGIGQIPLDQRQPGERRQPESAAGRRSEDVPLVGSRYQASETAMRRNRERRQREQDADWHRSDSPRIPRGFGRKQWTNPKVEVVLGIATLVSVALLIISMTLRVIFAPVGAAGIVSPTARIVNASALGYRPAVAPTPSIRLTPPATLAAQAPSASPAPASAAPPTIPGQWRRVELTTGIVIPAGAAFTPGRMDVASYDQLNASSPSPNRVHLWVQHLGSASEAASCLAALISHRDQLQGSITPGQSPALEQRQMISGRSTVAFDTACDASDTPGEVTVGSLRVWQAGSDVVTVASEDPVARDQFTRDYLSGTP